MSEKKQLNNEDVKDVNGGNKVDFNTDNGQPNDRGGAVYNEGLDSLRINSVSNQDNNTFNDENGKRQNFLRELGGK